MIGAKMPPVWTLAAWTLAAPFPRLPSHGRLYRGGAFVKRMGAGQRYLFAYRTTWRLPPTRWQNLDLALVNAQVAGKMAAYSRIQWIQPWFRGQGKHHQ